MDNDRCDRWSRALSDFERLAQGRRTRSPRGDTLARARGATASRRGVVGALLAALLAPRLPAADAAATQGEPCPCADPPCFLRKWGRDRTGPGQLAFPRGMAVAPDGLTVYVADTLNHRIQSFDAAGTYRGQWGSRGTGDGQFNLPSGVAVDSAGNVYVAETGNDRTQKVETF